MLYYGSSSFTANYLLGTEYTTLLRTAQHSTAQHSRHPTAALSYAVQVPILKPNSAPIDTSFRVAKQEGNSVGYRL